MLPGQLPTEVDTFLCFTNTRFEESGEGRQSSQHTKQLRQLMNKGQKTHQHKVVSTSAKI